MKKFSSGDEKRKLLEKVPKLTFSEVRRHRIPFHEALLAELKEANLVSAFDFFNEIVEFDLENSEQLVKDSKILEKIFDTLQQAESLSKEDGVELQLTLAGNLLEAKKLLWLVEKIYLRALHLIKHLQLEGSQTEAIAQYFNGKFICENYARHQEAVEYLEAAYKTSLNHDEWGTSIDCDEKAELRVVIANQLCKSLIKLSEQLRKNDAKEAMEPATRALEVIGRHVNTSNTILLIEAEIELVCCFQILDDTGRALSHLQHSLGHSKLHNLYAETFKILVKQSECYAAMKDDSKYEETLIEATDVVKLHLESKIVGDVLVDLGQYYAQQNKVEKATDFFEKASEIFLGTGEKMKLQKVRFLMAPLKGSGCFYEV